jgi:hypothetical protein
MADEKVGALLDSLGVTLDIEDGQQLTEVVVLGKLADFESGGTSVVIGGSEGLDWIAQRGLVSAAQYVMDTEDPAERP